MIAPRVLDEARDRRAQRADAPARSAPGRPARPAGRRPGRRAAAGRARTQRVGRRDAARGLRRGARLRRAPHAGLPAGARPTASARAQDVLEAREGDLPIVLRATVADDQLTLDFTGQRRAARGQPQLPAGRDPFGVLLRHPGAHRPRHPANAGAYRPIEVIAPEGSLLNARSPAAVVGGNVETSSRVADVVLAAFGRALGQGTMNNLTLGNEDVVYYETIGGGQGACAGRRRTERRPRGDEQHAQHAGRGARARVPAADGRVLAAARLGRRGPLPRRRRRDPRARGAGAAALLADHRAPPPRPARAPTAASRAQPGATCSTATSCQPRRSASSSPGQRLRIETPGGGGYGDARSPTSGRRGIIRRERARRIPGSGDHGLADGRQPGPRRVRAHGLEPHPAHGRARSPPSTAHGSPPRPPRPPREAEIVITMVVDGASGGAGAAGRATARPTGAQPGTLFIDCSTIGPAATRARSPGALAASAELSLIDAPVTGSSPKAAGRDADLHGRRSEDGRSRASGRCSTRWAR